MAEVIGLGRVRLDGEDIYWMEVRPTEGGRSVIVRRSSDGSITDQTPPPFNARSRGARVRRRRVHRRSDGVIYFSNFTDQRLYRQDPDAAPAADHAASESVRYADGVVDRRRGRLICVREDQYRPGRSR